MDGDWGYPHLWNPAYCCCYLQHIFTLYVFLFSADSRSGKYVRSIPRCSMYGIFTYIWVIFGVNVGTYSSTMEHLGFFEAIDHGSTLVPVIFLSSHGRGDQTSQEEEEQSFEGAAASWWNWRVSRDFNGGLTNPKWNMYIYIYVYTQICCVYEIDSKWYNVNQYDIQSYIHMYVYL